MIILGTRYEAELTFCNILVYSDEHKESWQYTKLGEKKNLFNS
jgi:hypothetical protein